MIKKCLLGLGIACLSLIGFSSAGNIQIVGNTAYNSVYNNNFALTFQKGGAVMSNYLGFSKSILALNDNVIFWRTPEGKPYFYGPSFQGYFNYFCSCDELENADSVPTNCSCTQMDGDYTQLFQGFFSNVKQYDLAYYDYNNTHGGVNCSYRKENVNVCRSSQTVGRTLCFAYKGSCYYGCQGGAGYCNGVMGGSFSSSNNYSDLTFTNMPYSYIGYAPGQAGYNGGGNIEGSSNIGENTTLTGNVMYNSCTVGYIVSQVSSEYGGINNVCYAGTNDTGTIQGGPTRTPVSQGLNFKEVYQGSINTPINGAYPYYSSYSDWFVSNSDLMYRWKLGQIEFPFNHYPVYLYTYFSRLYDNGNIYPGNSWEGYRIANFCKLAVYGDYSSEYNGTYFSNYCDDLNHSSNNGLNNNGGSSVSTGEIGSIDNNNQEILPPGYNVGGNNNQGSNTSSGNIISVDWSGTLSGDTNKNFEGKTFINDFYQKLQANFQKPYNGLFGIIPPYILVFMFALILFRFLSH